MFKKHPSVKWTILNSVRIDDQYFYECRCICGVEKLIHKGNIIQGKSTKCNKCGNKTHGDVYKRLYSIWRDMRARCRDKSYKDYHGRGVSVCKTWEDYKTFRKWALNNGYKENLSIDRINVNGNYKPSNCRWATPAQQSRNTRRNVKVNGIVAIDLSKELNVSHHCITKRIRKGWTIEEIRANPKEEKVMGLPKYISYDRFCKKYKVRYGYHGSIKIGAFKTLKSAEKALDKFLRSKGLVIYKKYQTYLYTQQQLRKFIK